MVSMREENNSAGRVARARREGIGFTEEMAEDWKRAIIWAWSDFQSEEIFGDFLAWDVDDWGRQDRETGSYPEFERFAEEFSASDAREFFQEWIASLRGYSMKADGDERDYVRSISGYRRENNLGREIPDHD